MRAHRTDYSIDQPENWTDIQMKLGEARGRRLNFVSFYSVLSLKDALFSYLCPWYSYETF